MNNYGIAAEVQAEQAKLLYEYEADTRRRRHREIPWTSAERLKIEEEAIERCEQARWRKKKGTITFPDRGGKTITELRKTKYFGL